jgi:ribosomal protein S18 acetylase RimI-like enzyme
MPILRRALKADGDRVFERIWSGRAEIPLRDSFYSDTNRVHITGECRRRRVWIVEADSNLCGALYLQLDQIFYLVVAKEYRRRGIGRMLLQRVKKPGRYCRVSPSNKAIISLIEREGFVYNPDRPVAGDFIGYDFKPTTT